MKHFSYFFQNQICNFVLVFIILLHCFIKILLFFIFYVMFCDYFLLVVAFFCSLNTFEMTFWAG